MGEKGNTYRVWWEYSEGKRPLERPGSRIHDSTKMNL
jgi:hypothetical protein